MQSPALHRSFSTAQAGPLAGIRVLDLTRVLAGPFCTQVLGDYGADVLKIENPRGGDDTRAWGPPFIGPNDAPESTYFMSVNRNKRSVAVDLKSPDGVAAVRAIARNCDVVVENFVPGKADELGVGWKDLNKVNNRLIYASVSGYGQTGPRADSLAYDVMISAMGGLMGATGPQDGAPAKVGVAITDICAGLFMHGAITAALLARERTGVGQRLDTSLLQSQVATLANLGSAYLLAGQEAKRWGTAHASIVPYQAFEAKDGHIVIGALNDGQFRRLAQALGRSEWQDDERFSTNPNRVANREALVCLISETVSPKPVSYWLARLEDHSVPCAPINDMKGVFADAQVSHLGMVQQVQHPTAGTLNMIGPAVGFSATPPSLRRAPPTLGQHTKEVLVQIGGLSEGDVNELAAAGVVKLCSSTATNQ